MVLILYTTVVAAVIILPHQIIPHQQLQPHLTLELTGMAEDPKYQKMLIQIIKHFIIF